MQKLLCLSKKRRADSTPRSVNSTQRSPLSRAPLRTHPMEQIRGAGRRAGASRASCQVEAERQDDLDETGRPRHSASCPCSLTGSADGTPNGRPAPRRSVPTGSGNASPAASAPADAPPRRSPGSATSRNRGFFLRAADRVRTGDPRAWEGHARRPGSVNLADLLGAGRALCARVSRTRG
jgi:hypothetical protein